MTDTFLSISYDLTDKKFLQLKEELTNEMKDQFNCTDYEQIVEYILKCIFENKQSKEKMISDTSDMFQDKTEKLYDFIWNITNRIYQTNKVDTIDEIAKEKDKGKQSKPLFNSAIEDVKKRKGSRSRSREREVDNRGEKYQFRGGYNNNRGRFIRGGFNFYQRGRGRFIEQPTRRGMNKGGPPNRSVEKKPKIEEKNNDNLNQINKEEGTHNKNSTNTNKIEQQQGNEQDQSKGLNKKKIRCKNWPQCKETNCEYSHPTDTCPFFPTCMYGIKCMYIHPNVPCKYGYYCTRVGCNYSHPAGWNPGMPAYQMQYPKKHFKKPNKDD